MSKVKAAIVGVVALVQAGCASSPGSIEARYVSPTTYATWSCSQLFDEKVRLSKEVERVSGLQRENANADAAMMTVGIVLFWPVLFGLAATKDRKEELGRLKGEYEAVDSNITSKQCSIPAPGTPSMQGAPSGAPAPAVYYSGTYAGQGTTDSWCATPSLSIIIEGSNLTGTLSEQGGANTGTITGNVDPSGQLVVNVKSGVSSNVSGTFRGTVTPSALNVAMKQPAPNNCSHKFSVPKK